MIQLAAGSDQITLPCACGGFVTANHRNPGPFVLAHYRGEMHRAWALQAYPEQPTADTYAVDLSDISLRASAAPGSKPGVQS